MEFKMFKEGLLKLPKIEDLPFLRLKRDLGIGENIGVYFLFDKNKILKYIGKSKRLKMRLESHRKTKNFLYFKYLKVDFCLDSIERIYIYKYQNFLNQKGEFWIEERIMYPSIDSVFFFKLLKSTTKKSHKSYFKLSFFLGLSLADLMNLKKEAFDFDARILNTINKVIRIPSQIKINDIKYIPVKIGARAISKAFLSASLRAGINFIVYTDKKGIPRYKYHFASLKKENGFKKN